MKFQHYSFNIIKYYLNSIYDVIALMKIYFNISQEM